MLYHWIIGNKTNFAQNNEQINIKNSFNENLNRKFSKEKSDNCNEINMDTRSEQKNIIYLKDNYIYYNLNKIMNINEKMNLKGMHNINNIMFVFAVCNILKLDLNKAIYSIKKFKPLEHRMEYIGKFDEIDFYNDSIATIPEATINSIQTIKNVNTLIVGGKDRGINLDNLINYLRNSNIQNIICLPKTGQYIFENLKNNEKNLFYIEDLEEAVKIAKKVTEKNKVCLLSPAASSYGYFKNFVERGNLFKKYVSSL